MGPDRDQTRDPWICSQTRICCQTRYRLRYVARFAFIGETEMYPVKYRVPTEIQKQNSMIFP